MSAPQSGIAASIEDFPVSLQVILTRTTGLLPALLESINAVSIGSMLDALMAPLSLAEDLEIVKSI